ncbi:MAG: EpsI family protein [Acidobacteria bacterium]|nr:EpsI family protein [Acidobacteriota bacterium]
MISQLRFSLVAVLLASAGLLLGARNSGEIIPAHALLASFPRTIGSWSAAGNIPLSKDVLDVLGAGEFLLREYQDVETRAQVALFIAYFPSQRAGDTIHSPQNCLPGAGWSPERADRITITASGHSPFSANRYVVSKGDKRQLVLYWYWAHDRGLASEYAAKFYLVADSIRMHRTDGSLIRISTSVADGQNLQAVDRILRSFANNLVPLLPTYVPR